MVITVLWVTGCQETRRNVVRSSPYKYFHYLGRDFDHRVAIFISLLNVQGFVWDAESSSEEVNNRNGQPIP